MKFHIPICMLILLVVASCYKPQLKQDDFDVFWQTAVNELGDDFTFETVKDTLVENKILNLVKIQSYQNVDIYAWVSTPKDSGTYPVFIKFSGFGIGNQNVNKIPYQWFHSQKKSINISVDIRGQGLSTDQIAFENYLTNGLENEHNYIYKGAYLDAVRIVDFASQLPRSNGEIIATGASQGGALATVAAALNPKVTTCIIGYPFLTDMFAYDKTQWPMKIWIHETKMKEWKLEELHKTLSYFDVLNFAERIDVPFFLRTQEVDKITPKEGALKLFNNVKTSKKKLFVAPCEGHGCSLTSKEGNTLESAFIKKNLINF